MKYSIVSYNFNNYEKFYEIPNEVIDPEAEYILFTDNRTIKSDTWRFVYMDCDNDPFYTVCKIRYNIFDYVDTDIVVMFDGSMRPIRDLRPIVNLFDKGGYDFSTIIHPSRNTLYSELCAWVNQRGMPAENAEKALEYFQSNGYDVMEYKGLFQINFMIMRNTKEIREIQKETMDICENLAEEGKKSFRCDQVVISYVINRKGINVMPIGDYICTGMYFNWYAHGTDIPMSSNSNYNIEPFMFNHSTYLAPIF